MSNVPSRSGLSRTASDLRCIAANIRAVKRSLCLLLTIWLVFQAGWAQAHVLQDDLHAYGHSEMTATALQQHTDPAHDEHCGTAYCSHAVGMLDSSTLLAPSAAGAFGVSDTRTARSGSHITDIERPKWPVATPAVASL